MPCKKLAELDGLTWYLTFASDVQYDPQDEAIAAAYTEMYQAAQAITPDALSFEGQTDRQWERLQEKRLQRQCIGHTGCWGRLVHGRLVEP